APIARPLHVLGLGGTVGTPRGGITAPVVVVHDWAELDARRDAVKGAIVVYDVAMPKWTEDKGSGYGQTVDYRSRGASRAAKYGGAGGAEGAGGAARPSSAGTAPEGSDGGSAAS